MMWSAQVGHSGRAATEPVPLSPARPSYWEAIVDGSTFWSNVDQSGSCWVWLRSRSGGRMGYGRVQFRGRLEVAHRVAWTLAIGPIPEGLFVLHKCDNPPCVRPDHLFLGTAQDNSRDRDEKGRHRSGLTGWYKRCRSRP